MQKKSLAAYIGAALVVFAVPASVTLAQDFPTKRITLINPYAAGGGSDYVSRLVAQHLSDRLGQSVIVENRGGASGNIGMAAGGNAAPDGYTMTTITQNITVNPHLYKQLGYDAMKSFQLVTNVIAYPSMLVVHPGLPVKNLAELIAYSKANPGKLTGGHGGVGGQAWLGMVMLSKAANIQMEYVTYRGESPVMTDLLSGRTQLTVQSLGGLGTYVQTGMLRAIAVTSPTRSPLFPDVPTVAETIPGFDLTGWYGIGVPAGTPMPIVHKLNKEIRAVLDMPEVRKELTSRGLDPVGDSPEEFTKTMVTEYEKVKKLIEDSGIKPN